MYCGDFLTTVYEIYSCRKVSTTVRKELIGKALVGVSIQLSNITGSLYWQTEIML